MVPAPVVPAPVAPAPARRPYPDSAPSDPVTLRILRDMAPAPVAPARPTPTPARVIPPRPTPAPPSQAELRAGQAQWYAHLLYGDLALARRLRREREAAWEAELHDWQRR